MFEVLLGDMNPVGIILAIVAVIILPVQLLLCFKVKSFIIRLMPIIILVLAVVITIVTNLDVSGWDGLLFVFGVIYVAYVMLMCGIGWGIWAIVKRIKKKR